MTREEAKELLLNISAYDIDMQRGMAKQEALEMAIQALEQEPCEDAIGMDAVIECLKNKDIIKLFSQEETARKELKELSSVTPQHKVGRWKKENPFLKSVCSECGESTIGYHGFDETLTKYCPNCGCRMMEVEE